jgi:hypothetical protein
MTHQVIILEALPGPERDWLFERIMDLVYRPTPIQRTTTIAVREPETRKDRVVPENSHKNS